ncbi:class A sortase [Domibacillus epiphyticus]|uniref:Class A sortase n=1 Tax=Domibacillus epiphyticus TaxID=1714355 RepID=A0A1V2A6N5_9BACI|nr:class A sortase [Domibacillus epiphyticus]OMP66673.1 class A sortase [Domibacillus epiphyticus]
MLRKVIAVICMIAAAIMIAAPFLKYELLEASTEKYAAVRLSPEEIKENSEKPAQFEMEAIQPPSVLDTVMNDNEVETSAIVGQIDIPSVNLSLPILKGTTNENLLVGATTMREDQWMGLGNYALAGHHMKKDTLLFSPILRVEKGAFITVTDLTYTYTYEVTKLDVVHESRTDILENTVEPVITLVTCYKSDEPEKRFIVHGVLKKTEEFNRK